MHAADDVLHTAGHHCMEQHKMGSGLIVRLDQVCAGEREFVSSGCRDQTTPSGYQMEVLLQSHLRPRSERSSLD